MEWTLRTLERLNESGVPYVLIGGMAAIAHGSSVNTQDVDICIAASDQNFRRIVEVFSDLHPRYRMKPDQPLLWPDHPWLKGLKNLYLRTDVGQIDILGEVPGIGDYETIKTQSVEIPFGSFACRVLDIPTLIEAKLIAGRPKDHQTVRELRVILDRMKVPTTKPE